MSKGHCSRSLDVCSNGSVVLWLTDNGQPGNGPDLIPGGGTDTLGFALGRASEVNMYVM